MSIQAIILAGGEGRRMRTLTAQPKALLPLAGKPLLAYQLEWLKEGGFGAVTLCLGYRADSIRQEFGDGSGFGVRLDYRVEAHPRGTAGAVRDLGHGPSDDLLIVYGDLYVDFPLADLLAFHRSHDGGATLVVRKTDHPEDSDLVTMDESGRIGAVGRLSGGKVSGDTGCTAVWVVRSRILDRVPETEPSDFARDLFPAVLEAGEPLYGFWLKGTVVDVGTPKRYHAFEKRFSAR